MADLLETVANAGNFNTLITAIQTAGLGELLKNSGPLTVLAPTDEAFQQLPESTVEELLQDIPKLKKIVTYHILSGDVRAEDLQQIDEAPTFEGSIVGVSHKNGLTVNDARVVKTDILTDNGVIHVIDQVLMPALVNDV